MNFINRHVLLYAAIVFASTLVMYYSMVTLQNTHSTLMSVIVLCNLAIMGLSLFFTKRNDLHEGYFGFNYHLATYLIYVGTPLLLKATGFVDELPFIKNMATVWGVGIVIHLLIMLFRNRRLKSYDKQEIFQ